MQAVTVGRGQGAQLVVAVQEVADGAWGDGDAPAGQLLVDLGEAAMLGVTQSPYRGQHVEAKLVVGQGQEGLGFGMEGAMKGGTVGVGGAAYVHRQSPDGVEGGDGAAVGVRGPEDVVAFRAMRGDGLERLGLGGRRSAVDACHDSGLLASLPPFFYPDVQATSGKFASVEKNTRRR